MKLNLIKLYQPTANNKNKYHMKQFYYLKHLLFSLCLLAFGLSVQAQTTYDWQTSAPDGNWKQGAASGPRWNPGGLWDEPPSGSGTRLRFDNNTFPTMTNNVTAGYIIGQLFFGSSATSARSIGGNSVQFFEFGGTWPRIENQSTTLHTINFPFAASTNSGFNMELVASSGSMDFGASATINNNGRTVQIYGNNTATDGTNRAIRLGGVVSGSGILNVSQFGVVKLNATHTYTGQTQIDNGELWIESAGSIAAGSSIFVGNGAQLANVTKFWISNSSGGSTVSNAITINNGNTTTRYLGGLNSSGTHTFSGAITNNSTTGGLNLSALTSGGTTTFSGVISGGGAVITEGAGTVILSGASQNTWTSTLTTNGTLLVLNKSADTRAIGTGNMTIATGATVRTDANNQLGTGTPSLITINGTGIFNLNNTNQKIALASASSTASVTLGSGTLNIDNTGTDTYAGTISGSGAVTKTNTGIEILTNTTNNYTGATTITAGEIRLQPSANATFASQIVLNGGTLGTTGITATRTWTSSSTLNVTAKSTIALLSATAHTLTFANSSAVSWTAGKIVTITGWSGSYNGTTGTGGKIFFGNSAAGLTAAQLLQIYFYNGTNMFTATILSTGEVVPTATIAMFWGGTAAENWVSGNKWSLVDGTPYASAWTNGRAAVFNVASSTITIATAGPQIASLTVFENVTVTYTNNTLTTGGTQAPVFIASGKLFNFAGTAISSAAGTGFIKNGTGILNMGAAGGSTMPAGYTINDGIVAVGGNNGMGTGTLTINGGTIVNNSGTSRSPGNTSIVVNNNFGLGDIVNFAAGTGNLIFSGTVNLGASVTRTITLGTSATYSLNGIISGSSSNLILAATAAGTLGLGGANTYGGNTTINGGTLRPTVTGALPSTTALSFANTAGAILDLSTNGITPTVASLSGGGSTGGNISFGASITTTLTVGNASNTTYSGLISGASLTTGGLVKVGSGILTLGHTANTYTGTTTITAGELRLNPSTITGSFASQIVLNGGKLSTTSIAASTVFTSTSTLKLDATSTIDLGSNAHDLKFAASNGVTWNGTALVINNWTGTPAASGTAGRIFVGSANTHLDAGQLAKITFTGYVGAMLLATGELVPVSIPTTYTWDGSASSDWATGANWDLGTVPLSTDHVVIPTAASYTNALIITGARTVTDFTVNGTGTYSMAAAASLTVNGTFNYASSVAATYNCASTLTIASTASQTIPAANYGNLDLTGGNRTLASSGTIGICGTFTRGAGTYTITGSTVDYNGSGAQTIAAGTYNNLTISNARSAANLTSPAGTIAVAGTFDISALSAYTPVVNAASIFDFTSAGAQSIPAFFYGQLNNTGNGARTWASSGIIDVNQNFSPGAGTHTVTGSTMRYSATSGTIIIPTFASSATPRSYNNLIFNGSGGTFVVNATTFGVAGTVNVTAGTFVSANGSSTTVHVDGTFTIDGGTLNINSSAVGAILNLYGDFVMSSATGIVKTGNGTTNINLIKASGNQNISQTAGTITNAGGGTTTWNVGNGTTTNTVVLNTNFSLVATSMVVLNLASLNFANFTLSGAHNFATNAGGTLIFGASGTLNNTGTFGLASTATLATANIDGVTITGTGTGSILSSGTRTYTAGANFTFNGSADQITGTAVGANLVGILTINTTSGARVTLTKPAGTSVQITNTVNLASGILILNLVDLYLGATATFTGSPWTTANMVVTTNNASRYIGRIIKIYPNGPQTGLTFTYPLGDITGTVEYSPVNITNLTYTAATSPYMDYKVKDAQHPNDATFNNYLSRYWETVSSFPSGSGITMTATYNYTAADIVGTEGVIKMNRYDSPTGTWTEDAGSSCASNVMTSITLNGAASPLGHMFDDDDMVGRLDVPIYFRSAASGVFEVASNWIVSTDPTFTAPTGVTAGTYPLYSNSAGIRIMNTHNMGVAVGCAIDDATIDAGGTLTLGTGSTNFIMPGAGTDLTVNGTLTNSAGTINVFGSIDFGATGIYNHNISGALIPLATWAVGSNCRVTGPMAAAPGNLGQAFSDFTWNAPGQTGSFSLSSGLTNVGRDLNMANTNGFVLGLTSTTALALSVGRDLNVSGGLLTLVTGGNANAVSMAVANNVNISGGNLTLCNGATTGASSITVTNNFNLTGSGSFTEAGTNASNNAGTVTLTVSGAFNNSSTSASSFIMNDNTKTTVTATIAGVYTQSGSGTTVLKQTSGSGTATLNCNNTFSMSNGTFTVLGAGALGSPTSTLNIKEGFDMSLTGGTFTIGGGVGNSGTGNVNVGTITSTSNGLDLNGATLNVATAATGNLNLFYDCALTSGSLNQTGGTANVVFKAQGVAFTTPKYQSFTQGSATITGAININNGVTTNYCSVVFGSNINLGAGATLAATNSNSYFDFANFVLTGNAFTQSSNANIATANVDGFNSAGAIGSVQTSTRTYSASGSFIYSGTTAQVTGTGTANAFTISAFNPSGVTLSQNTTITGVFGGAVINYGGYAGKLYLSNFNLTLTAGATVVNIPFSNLYYIVTNGTGKLFQTVGASDITYMIGNSAYNPITLNNSGTSDAYGVRVIDAVTSPSPNDATKLINRYWDITENVAGGSTLAANDLTPTYNSGEENVNFTAGTTLKMGYHNGAGWTEVTATSSGAGPFTIDNNATISPAVANYTIGIGKDDAFLNPSTTYTWNGSVSSSWTTPANWTPATSAPGVGPTLTDNAIVNVPGTNTLDITGSRGINDFDLSGTGTFNISAGASLNIAGNLTYTSSATPTFDCASTLSISSGSSQTIPAFNYGSLNASGGDRVLASSGTIGVCGTFTPGAGTYTITGSTINYNGTGAQTITVFKL